MILEYRIKSGSILDEDNLKLIITISSDQTFVELLAKLDYKYNKKINDFIYIYTQSTNKNKHAMIATLMDMSDMNEYLNNLSTLLFAIYEKLGKKISVYLPSVQNFNDLAAAIVKFCEKNMDYNFSLQFFTDDKNLNTLDFHLKSLELAIRNRQTELSNDIFQRFKCISCRFFAYSPSITSCCHKILCKKCSRLEKCPKCFLISNPTNLTELNFLFESLPYHCFCGSHMSYSEKRSHSEICEIRWYQCKLCNKKISFSQSIQHFNEEHFQAIFMDNLF